MGSNVPFFDTEITIAKRSAVLGSIAAVSSTIFLMTKRQTDEGR